MRLRVCLVGAGCLAMAYALWQLATGGVVTSPVTSGFWVLGSALTHDLILAPAVALVGLLLSRLAPRPVRPVLAGGLLVAGCLLLVSLPPLLDRGGQGNVTTTPLDYRRGILISLGVVLVATASIAVATAVRAARKQRPATDQDSSIT